MIVPSVPCFFMIKATGGAAETVTSQFSPSIVGDIDSVVLLSVDFTNDIDAIKNMDATVDLIVNGMSHVGGLESEEKFNPIYIPNSIGDIDEALSLDTRTDGYRFTGMEGNPFICKMRKLSDNDELVIEAKVQYHNFDLPSYSELVEKQGSALN